ncbi:MAG: hypothetical protein ACT4OW_06490 [Nitrososphaerota archaeon]
MKGLDFYKFFMDSKLRTYAIIGGAVAAAAIIIGVVAITGAFDNKMDTSTQITEQQTTNSQEETVTFKEEQPLGSTAEITELQTDSQPYRLNTSCEMLYAMSSSEYPNGEKLHSLSITGVVSKYQEEFKPWLETFADEQRLRAFIDQGFSPEFLDVFAEAVILEYSINPELKPLVNMALDPKTTTVDVNKIFEEDNCLEYYVSRKGPETPQP